MVSEINITDTPTPQNTGILQFVPLDDYILTETAFLDNSVWQGLMVITEVASLAGGATLTVTIGTLNPVTGDVEPLAQSAAIAAPGTTILTIYPGITEVANEKVSQVLPKRVALSWSNSAPGNIIRFGAGGYLVI